MGDTGRQLLEGDVRHGVQHVQVVRAGKALRHVRHAFAFKGHRVDGARGQQVIADRGSCRPSSAVQRLIHVPQAPSVPNDS